MRICQEGYKKQKIGPSEEWEFVGATSKESKIRRGDQ